MKFIVDMDLSPLTEKFLQELGYEAIRVNNIFPNRQGIEDEEIFEYALKNNFHIITGDLDFGHILANTKSDRPSVIVIRLQNTRIANVNTAFEKTLPQIQSELKTGHIIALEQNRIKLRKLPI